MSHNNKDSVQLIAQNASTPCFPLRPSLHWGPFGELTYIGHLYCYSHPTLTVSYRIRTIKVIRSLRASYYRSARRTRWQIRKVNPHLDLSSTMTTLSTACSYHETSRSSLPARSNSQISGSSRSSCDQRLHFPMFFSFFI